MASRLLNVRLDEDRQRKARRLRQAGLVLSDVVREAIDARFEAVQRPMTGREAAARMTHVLGEYPDPEGLSSRRDDVHDARASRRAIQRILKRRSR